MISRCHSNRLLHGGLILALSSSLALQPAGPLFAGEECGDGRDARPAPQTRPGMSASESLWPTDSFGSVTFRPATNPSGSPLPIPSERDSASYVTQTIPGASAGHELFMDVARLDNSDDWLFTAYNAGLQVWDLRNNPKNPLRQVFREGWQGHFFDFPEPGEVDTYVETIDAVQAGGNILVGLGGRNGNGFSVWEFTPPNTLTQHCQDTSRWIRQVEMVESGGTAYAFASASDGVHVYNATAATGSGETCPYLGKVGTMNDGNYVSVLKKDGDFFVAASDGSSLPSNPLGMQIWKTNPANPSAATLLFSGFNTNTRSPTLFKIPGAVDAYFIGLIENNVVEFYDVESCLEHVGAGTCGSLGAARATESVDSGSARQFLDISYSSDGRTWGYYGMEVVPGNLRGDKYERLLDLTPLANTSGFVNLEEITDGGDTYNNTSPCSNSLTVDYWGDYYPNNRFGVNLVIPRHGIFVNDLFHRAAYSMYDIHELGSTAAPSSIGTSLDGASSTLWLDETASYTGAPGGSCAPTTGNWCWVVEAGGTDLTDSFGVSPDLGDCNSAYTNPETFDYNCTPGPGKGRCDDGSAMVTAWNTSCGAFPPSNTQSSSASVTLKDPTVDIEGSLNTGGTLAYQQCQTVPLDAELGGRGPISWQWQVDGEPLTGCSGSVSGATDISLADVSCLWDTSGVVLQGDDIFADGFESGNPLSWTSVDGLPTLAGVKSSNRASRAVPMSRGGGPGVDLNVQLVVSNAAAVIDTELAVINIQEIADPSFVNGGSPILPPVVVGNTATLQAPANDTSTWTWELEDPDQGTAPCSFDAGATCATVETIVDTLQYSWITDGTYDFEVSVSNCVSSADVSASGNATVSAAVAPDVVRFRVSGSTPACCGIPNFDFKCVAGVPITMEVEMAEEAGYIFGFDWERLTQASAVFTTQTPTSSSGDLYLFTHTFSSSGSERTVFPIVQATSGLATDQEDFFTGGGELTILPAGSVCQ